MNFGIIGCGGIADRRTIPGMIESDEVKITAVQDSNFEIARTVAEKYGVDRVCESAAELAGRDDIEAVYIGTPVFAHGAQVMAAADAGKHVLCEKPLALSVRETKKIIEHCDKRGVTLQVGFMMRYHSTNYD